MSIERLIEQLRSPDATCNGFDELWKLCEDASNALQRQQSALLKVKAQLLIDDPHNLYDAVCNALENRTRIDDPPCPGAAL